MQVGGDELLGEGVVGGEEEVDGGAVLDLLREGGGGAVADGDVGAGGVLVGFDEGGHDGLEVGGGGDAELFWLRLSERVHVSAQALSSTMRDGCGKVETSVDTVG